ncbi:MAG: hypothetical protein K5978_08190 [Campylobacter sp.]|nr:hypothetical protein [Campylobacter sp.]
MKQRDRRSLLPLTYIFGSFFGAAMIAIAFAYNDYRFSRYKFINFSDFVLYEKTDIFEPKHENYLLVLFSSRQMDIQKVLSNLETSLPILAVDIYQQRLDSNSSMNYVSTDINSILKLINLLNIKHIPSAVEIQRQKNGVYKQDSKILEI